jgi:hypothetical protein
MQNKVPSFGVGNAMVPKEGPKIIPLLLDFTGGTTAQYVDLVNDSQLGYISIIQAIYIDNSLSNAKTVVTILGSQQVITCPAGWQGFFPLFTPMPPKMTIQNAGGISITVILCNMPMPASAWPGGTYGTPTFDVNGKAIVTDQTLDGLVTDLGLGFGPAFPVFLPNTAQPGDAKALAAGLSMISALGVQYNGTTTELVRGNTEGTAIASANRAVSTVNSADIINYSKQGVTLFTNISALSAGGVVTAKVQLKDPVSGLYADVPGGVTNGLNAVGLNMLQMDPGIDTTAGIEARHNISRTFRIQAAVTVNNVTFSCGYALH